MVRDHLLSTVLKRDTRHTILTRQSHTLNTTSNFCWPLYRVLAINNLTWPVQHNITTTNKCWWKDTLQNCINYSAIWQSNLEKNEKQTCPSFTVSTDTTNWPGGLLLKITEMGVDSGKDCVAYFIKWSAVMSDLNIILCKSHGLKN